MARSRRSFVCRNCGAESPAWAGRCNRCDAWASIEELDAATTEQAARSAAAVVSVQPLQELIGSTTVPSPTGLDEFDRVLGGGLTPGSVTLLGGEPGVGKSTLTLQAGLTASAGGASVLLVAGEEAPTQIAARASRVGRVPPALTVIDNTSVDAVIAAMEETRPFLVVVDSIQTVRVDDVDGSPGSVGQLRAATERLVAAAKRLQSSVIMVGHVTKDGALAGPRVIEHLVDTVLSFAGDRSGELRYLRAVKHRFGPTSEVGLFAMTHTGLGPVDDPSGRFLTDRQPGVPGSVVVPTLEGRRPVLVELQALTVDVAPEGGRVTVQGLDGRRLALVSAVLTRRAGWSLARNDVFVSATGGAVVTEPGADLGVAVALASSLTDVPTPPELVACGEIGLGGEVRSVPRLELRLQEAYRLGFRSAIVPASAPEGPAGMTLFRAETVADALSSLGRRPRAA
ncbi:MAG: DNA repair protein RadA [Acidimicrobiales bacterium]